ncbi:MAG: hypothetical protein NTY35_03190 [Planctomycetota bacterium]|nr:hypothetical protein [Planctomycetota bacterium]
MIVALTLCLLPWPTALSASVPAPVSIAAQDPALDAKIAAAGKDVAKLLELAASFVGGPMQASADKVYKRVIELEPDNEVARKALRHQSYDGKWFESFAELAKYKREEAARMKAKGLARFKEEWVPEGDVPFLTMGWTKDAQKGWIDPSEAALAKQVDEWKAAGYQFRADDNSWIAPEDFEKWTALQWKCGQEWVDLAKANEYHSKIETSWELMGEHYEVWATCDWEGANLARWHADKTHAELVRIFGTEPAKKQHLVVLNSLTQYNQAAGNQPILIETEGISSLHGSYFADGFFDNNAKPPQYLGCGVSYWDRKDPKLAVWGPYWLRFAAAQSFVEGIDPSWAAVAQWIADGGRGDLATYSGAFWTEKKIPRWLRYGAASYVERFMKNPEAAEGADPWTLRTFAFGEIKKAGGLHKLDDVFAFKLDIKDIPNSSRLYHEAGLLVAYMLDGAGADKELPELHKALQAALKTGVKADITTTATALQKALAKREREIKKFAGL